MTAVRPHRSEPYVTPCGRVLRFEVGSHSFGTHWWRCLSCGAGAGGFPGPMTASTDAQNHVRFEHHAEPDDRGVPM